MDNNLDFGGFLLAEDGKYFGAKIGDVLNAVQELAQAGGAIGSRHARRLVRSVCNEIRVILRRNWTLQQQPYLERLQRVGVALMKAVDGGDLVSTLASAQYELEAIMGKLDVPVNRMGSDVAEEVQLG